jgi:hypothetical protein
VKDDIKIMGNCVHICINLYKQLFFNFENKLYLKIGSIKLPEEIKSKMRECNIEVYSFIDIENINYNDDLFHCWIEIEINGKNVIIDTSRKYMEMCNIVDFYHTI